MQVELHLPAEGVPGEPARPVVVDTNVALDLLIFSDPRTAPLRTLLTQGRLDWIATQVMRDELEQVLATRIVSRMDFTAWMWQVAALTHRPGWWTLPRA